MLSRLLFSASQFEGMNWRAAFDDCKQARAKKQISTKNISLRLAVIDPDSDEHAALLRQASEEIRTRKSKL